MISFHLYFILKIAWQGSFSVIYLWSWSLLILAVCVRSEFKGITNVWAEQRWENQTSAVVFSAFWWFHGLRGRLSQTVINSAPCQVCAGLRPTITTEYKLFYLSHFRLIITGKWAIKEKRTVNLRPSVVFVAPTNGT